MLEQLTQLTIGTVAVATLGFTIKYFLKHLGKRDDFLENLIDNHFRHSRERDEKVIDSIDRLTDKVATKL